MHSVLLQGFRRKATSAEKDDDKDSTKKGRDERSSADTVKEASTEKEKGKTGKEKSLSIEKEKEIKQEEKTTSDEEEEQLKKVCWDILIDFLVEF